MYAVDSVVGMQLCCMHAAHPVGGACAGALPPTTSVVTTCGILQSLLLLTSTVPLVPSFLLHKQALAVQQEATCPHQQQLQQERDQTCLGTQLAHSLAAAAVAVAAAGLGRQLQQRWQQRVCLAPTAPTVGLVASWAVLATPWWSRMLSPHSCHRCGCVV